MVTLWLMINKKIKLKLSQDLYLIYGSSIMLNLFEPIQDITYVVL